MSPAYSFHAMTCLGCLGGKPWPISLGDNLQQHMFVVCQMEGQMDRWADGLMGQTSKVSSVDLSLRSIRAKSCTINADCAA